MYAGSAKFLTSWGGAIITSFNDLHLRPHAPLPLVEL